MFSSDYYYYPATIFFTFLAIFSIKWLFFNRTRLHLPPGPMGLPILGSLLSLDPELHSYFADLARVHGPIFSLWLGSKLGVVITSPSLAKEVLKDHDITFANHDVPIAGKIATYGGADIAWNPYGSEWRLLRKVCVRDMLGPATLEAVYGLRRREIRRAVRLISGWTGQPVNIGEEMFMMVFNVVRVMLWGGRMKGGGEEKDGIGREFRKVVGELVGLLGAPNVSDFYPGLGGFDLQGIEKKMKGCAGKLDGILERVINQRMKERGEGRGGGGGDNNEKDFLEVLLQLLEDYKEGGDGGGKSEVKFSMTHLKALLVDMVTAGTDTTSNTIEFAMAEVINNPKVLQEVQQELDMVVGNDNIVEEHHIQKLPYLQAVMKESLRLHTTLPLLIPHCPSESCTIGGYTIPKGSRIFINAWAIHRDPLVWANPLEFNPERFLTAKFDFSGKDFTYFPFGSGRRSCAGIGMAERMVLFSLASLLHSFNWKLPKGEKLEVDEKFGIVLTKRKPLIVIPEHRLRNLALYE